MIEWRGMTRHLAVPAAILLLLACSKEPGSPASSSLPLPPNLSLPKDPPAAETVTIPGTPVKFDVLRLGAGTYPVTSPDGKSLRAMELAAVAIGAREVTWGEFNHFYERREKDGVTRPTEAKSYFGQVGIPGTFLNDPRPTTNVRWHSAMGFCEWLSLKTGGYYRLPTEAEWEAACRAGKGEAAPSNLNEIAWHSGNTQATADAGSKKPNPWGFYDLLGNVWEVCLESGQPGIFAPVFRGGAWNLPPSEARADRRFFLPEAWYSTDVNNPPSVWWFGTNQASQGFRIVRVLEKTEAEKAYIPQVEIGTLKGVAGTEQHFRDICTVVTGEIRNRGDRLVDELELLVHPLDGKGRPVFLGVNSQNVSTRALFARAYPVLRNSYHEGDHRKPLKPGEARAFTAVLPGSWADGEVAEGKFAARVTNLRFSSN